MWIIFHTNRVFIPRRPNRYFIPDAYNLTGIVTGTDILRVFFYHPQIQIVALFKVCSKTDTEVKVGHKKTCFHAIFQ